MSSLYLPGLKLVQRLTLSSPLWIIIGAATSSVLLAYLISRFLNRGTKNKKADDEPVWSDSTGVLDFIRLVRAKGLGNFVSQRLNALKTDTFAVRLPPGFAKTIFVCHPDDMKAVIAKEHSLKFTIAMPASYEGLHGIDLQLMSAEKHKVWRKILSAIIAPRALESYVPHLLSAFTIMWDEIKAAVSDNKTVVLRDQIRRTQLRVMAKLLYDLNFSESEEDQLQFDQLDADFELECAALFAPAIDRAGTAYSKGLAAAKRIRNVLMQRFLTARDTRRAMKLSSNCSINATATNATTAVEVPVRSALDTIIDAIDEFDAAKTQHQLPHSATTAESLFSLENISNNLLLLLEAAHGTTMYATTSLFGELLSARNSACLQAVKSEAAAVTASTTRGQQWSLAVSVTALPFTDACINEILRLYPFAGGVPINLPAGKEVRLPHSKVTLRGPTQVLLSFAQLFTDPQIFPQPLLFCPQRWLPRRSAAVAATSAATDSSTSVAAATATSTITTNTAANDDDDDDTSVVEVTDAAWEAFTPFGMGAHVCLGQKLAWLTMRTAVFTFAHCNGLQLRLESDPVQRVADILPMYLVADGVRVTVPN